MVSVKYKLSMRMVCQYQICMLCRWYGRGAAQLTRTSTYCQFPRLGKGRSYHLVVVLHIHTHTHTQIFKYTKYKYTKAHSGWVREGLTTRAKVVDVQYTLFSADGKCLWIVWTHAHMCSINGARKMFNKTLVAKVARKILERKNKHNCALGNA